MNNKLLISLSAVVLIGQFTSANAADFSYNYIEGAFEDIERDGADGDVFRVSGSYDITPNINIIAEYASGDFDSPLGGGDIDTDEGVIGIGYHTGIAPNTDFTANLKIVDQDIEGLSDDTGYGIGVGLRHMFTHNIEGDVNVDFVDVDDNDDTAFKLGARYYFNSAISAGLAYSTSSEDLDVVSGNLRWNF